MNSPTPGRNPVGIRLAMRVEGDFWVAYCAMTGTMDGAIEMGRIAMGLVGQDNSPSRRRKDNFMAMMQESMSEIIYKMHGEFPTWNDPTRAPEHEKSGRA